jgi:hypothetical protein
MYVYKNKGFLTIRVRNYSRTLLQTAFCQRMAKERRYKYLFLVDESGKMQSDFLISAPIHPATAIALPLA